MSTGYEPNIEGAITVLVDILTANAFTLTRQPYEPNYRGLVDAIIDLKEGFPIFAPTRVGFGATAFESVADGDAVYMRVVDGLVGKASAASGTIENATVIGFTDSAASPGDTFVDNTFRVSDNGDATKKLAFECTGITTATTRTMTVPDENGTIATQDFATAIAIALG
jgi:hypothetical protein